MLAFLRKAIPCVCAVLINGVAVAQVPLKPNVGDAVSDSWNTVQPPTAVRLRSSKTAT